MWLQSGGYDRWFSENTRNKMNELRSAKHLQIVVSLAVRTSVLSRSYCKKDLVCLSLEMTTGRLWGQAGSSGMCDLPRPPSESQKGWCVGQPIGASETPRILVRALKKWKKVVKYEIMLKVWEVCWKMLENVENCWKILENVEKCWKMWENCWKMWENVVKLLKNVGKCGKNCWKMWENVTNYGEMWENVGKLLKKVGKCDKLLKNEGKCGKNCKKMWENLKNVGKCGKILEKCRKIWQIIEKCGKM